MANSRDSIDIEPSAPTKKQLQLSAPWFTILGICLILLGTLAIYFSVFTTLVSIFYLGISLIILGIFEALHSFNICMWSRFFLHLFLSVIYLVGGAMIIAYPIMSEINITLFLSFFFIVTGILKLIFALTHHMANKIWNMLDGIVSLLLGILILQQWPESGLWVIGMFVGINMLLTGWNRVMLSYEINQIK
ncbi:MAG: DUF308 domain-containing protein [Candidatus Babeliaceae bacterium]|nr:DUF308 domain-containing protein [Candidatus Babeliaceae bacterium]